METIDLKPFVQDLEGNIDDLEEALAPLLKTALSESTAKLPLLDKAKLYVLVTYAIESILFSFLKLNGVNAREHPVFRELTRVKQYFEKIKEVETSGLKRDNLSLDKQAAGRFIKHALAGNDEYDRRRAERQAKEKAAAKVKFEEMTELVGSHQRFKTLTTKRKAGENGDKVRDVEASSDSISERSSSSAAESEAQGVSKRETHKRRKVKTTSGQEANAALLDEPSQAQEEPRKRQKTSLEGQAEDAAGKERQKAENEERIIPRKSNQTPRGHSAAFQALLQGPLQKKESKKPRGAKRKERRSGVSGEMA